MDPLSLLTPHDDQFRQLKACVTPQSLDIFEDEDTQGAYIGAGNHFISVNFIHVLSNEILLLCCVYFIVMD